MAKEPKGPTLPTLEEKWAQEDADAPFGFDPNTMEPATAEEFDLEAIEAELDGTREEDGGEWDEVERDQANT